MAKKKEEDIRNKFLKIMLTEVEFKEIDRYAKMQFQTKSDFIRFAIRTRIDEINRSIYPNKNDPRFERGRFERHKILQEIKDSLSVHEKGELLKKPTEEELKEREKLLGDRKRDLEKELQNINKLLEG